LFFFFNQKFKKSRFSFAFGEICDIMLLT